MQQLHSRSRGRGATSRGLQAVPRHEVDAGLMRRRCLLHAGVGEEVCAVRPRGLFCAVRLPEGARRQRDAPHRRPRRWRPPVTAALCCPMGP